MEKDSTLLNIHEKIIDSMHLDYLTDVPILVENKHIIDNSLNINHLQQFFQIDDLIDGSYLSLINNLDEDEVYSRFISKKSLKLYRKDKLTNNNFYLLYNQKTGPII